MVAAEPFLVPGFIVTAVAAPIHWVVLQVVVTLVIAIGEALCADAGRTALHALVAAEGGTTLRTSHDLRAHLTVAGVGDVIFPGEEIGIADVFDRK